MVQEGLDVVRTECLCARITCALQAVAVARGRQRTAGQLGRRLTLRCHCRARPLLVAIAGRLSSLIRATPPLTVHSLTAFALLPLLSPAGACRAPALVLLVREAIVRPKPLAAGIAHYLLPSPLLRASLSLRLGLSRRRVSVRRLLYLLVISRLLLIAPIMTSLLLFGTT